MRLKPLAIEPLLDRFQSRPLFDRRRQVIMEGYLLKQGEKNQSFQKRWCRLQGVTVSYYASKDASKRAGVFHVGGAEVDRDGIRSRESLMRTEGSLRMMVRLSHPARC